MNICSCVSLNRECDGTEDLDGEVGTHFEAIVFLIEDKKACCFEERGIIVLSQVLQHFSMSVCVVFGIYQYSLSPYLPTSNAVVVFFCYCYHGFFIGFLW